MIQEIHEAYWVPAVLSYTIHSDGEVTKQVLMRCGQQLRDRTRCDHVMLEQPGMRVTGVHYRVWPDDPWRSQ